MLQSDALASVRAFHHAFSHPAPAEPATQPLDRAKKRASWIIEEAEELRAAATLVDQADAVVDAFYFNLGGLVELGVPDDAAPPEFTGPVFAPRVLDDNSKEVAASILIDLAQDLSAATTREAQEDCYRQGVRACMLAFKLLGIDYKPLFDIVHGANMAKLHLIDGALVAQYHPDSKVKKPEGWVAPEPLLEAEVARQVAQNG